MSSVSGVSSSSYGSYATTGAANSKPADSVQKTTGASGTGSSAQTGSQASGGVIYEPSAEGKAAAASAKGDRTAIVAELKAANEQRIKQMTDLVQKMISGQGKAIGQADSIWSFLAKGDFTVDAQTKAQAQKDIAEDGYWGVEQTSQRIFDFAMALTGGDSEKMEKMRSAFEKGFAQATKTWGKELPEISQRTYSAVQNLFDQYKNQTQSGGTVS